MMAYVESNGGQAAGRDINNYYGPPSLPAQIAEPPESQRQAEFHRHTGIWARLEAREALEALMRDHGFTAPRLCAAWKSNNLRWSESRRCLRVAVHWSEAAYAYGAALAMAIYTSICILALLLVRPELGSAKFVNGMVGAVAGALSLALVLRYLVVPLRVAERVRHVLGDADGAKCQKRARGDFSGSQRM